MKPANTLLIFVISILFVNSIHAGKIVYPWRATSAIVIRGESFQVWFDADNGQTINSVELHAPYHSVNASFSLVTGSWIYDQTSGNKYDTEITVTVPYNAPADRYDLVLRTSSGEEISTGAVKVIKKYKDYYYVLHMSDAHRWQTSDDYDGIHTLRKVSQILKIANIIDPEFIVETGDNMYNVRNHPDREVSYFHGIPEEDILGMHDAYAATFMAAGNHDSPRNNSGLDDSAEETALFYNQYYGLHAHNFLYGSARYMVVNDGWVGYDYSHQVDDAVSWLSSVGNGNLRVGMAHIKDGPIKPLYNAVDPALILAGHNHHISDENPHPINEEAIQYTANSVRDVGNFEFNLFRVNNAAGEYTAVSGSTARVQVIKDSNRDKIADPSQWVSNLELEFSGINNGSNSDNTVTIHNRYDFPIYDAKIRFVMQKGNTYGVSPGTIQQAFDGDNVHIVDVAVDLDANSSTEVNIFNTGTMSNNAVFVSQSASNVMQPGETYPVEIVMVNTGDDPWTSLDGQKLGSRNPQGNFTWGKKRIELPHAVAAGDTVIFAFDVTAPEERGIYNFQWRMVDDIIPNQEWFGEETANMVISVGAMDMHIEAEDFTVNSGFQAQATEDVGGGQNMGFTDGGDYLTYDINITHSEFYDVHFRVASYNKPIVFDLREGSTILCSVDEPTTGGWQNWKTVTRYISLDSGPVTLTIFAVEGRWNINWFEIIPSGGVTGIEIEHTAPSEFVLSQNYPNPFNPTTTIEYSIPANSIQYSVGGSDKDIQSTNHSINQSAGDRFSSVKLIVYDMLGQEVAVLVNEEKSPGSYSVQFDANGLPSGIYMYKLSAGSFVQSRKMVLLK